MKKVLGAVVFSVAVLTIYFTAFAGTPFIPEVEKRFQTVEKERTARFVYDATAGDGSIGAHALGVKLPANAIITQSWYYIVTQFVDSGSGTVALHCEDANNILTAGDITGVTVGTTTTGASTGSAATMVKAIAAECEITATVATAAQDTGLLVGFVRYVVGQ